MAKAPWDLDWGEETPGFSGRGSWYSQAPGWVDLQDRPGSNALGVPDEQQGIALPSRKTLGEWFDVDFPDGTTHRLQQTDVGPAGWTGRKIDISAAAASRVYGSPKQFPTDAPFKWRVAGGPPSPWEMSWPKETQETPQPAAAPAQKPPWEMFGGVEAAAEEVPQAPQTPPEETGVLGRLGKGFAQGVTGTVGAMVGGLPTTQEQLRTGGIMGPGYDPEFERAVVGESVAAEQERQRQLATETMRAAGAQVEKFGREQFPITPGAEGLLADVGRGFGSVGANIALSLVSPAAGALGAIAQGQGGQVQDAVAKGATPEQVDRAAHLGTIAGATEFVDAALPFLGTPGKVAGLVGRVGARVLQGAFVEGGQEGLQQAIQNAIAKGIYDPERDISEGVSYNALVGGIVGGVVTGVAGRRGPAASAEPAPPADRSIQELTAPPAALPGEKEPEPAGVAEVFDTPRRTEVDPAGVPDVLTIVPPEGGEIRMDVGTATQPVFYSELYRTAVDKLPNSAPPQQMLGVLQNQPKVKPAEIEESGLGAFLNSRLGQKVSKADVLEFLEENGIQVEEVFTTRGPGYVTGIPGYVTETGPRAAVEWEGPGPRQSYVGYVAPGPIQSYTELRLSVKRKPDELPYVDPHWSDVGDENTVGHVQITTRVDKAGNPVAHIEGIQSTIHQLGRDIGYLTTEEAARVQRIRQEQTAIGAEKDRLDAQRKSLLDESLTIKADFVQARSRGLPTSQYEARVVELINLDDSLKRDIDLVADRYRALGREVDRLRDVVRMPTLDRPKIQRKPPPLPFKTHWQTLLVRRMFRWAADNGYSKISWANPELAIAWNTGARGLGEEEHPISPETKKFLMELYGEVLPRIMKKEAKRFGGVLGASEVDITPRGQPTQVVRVQHVTIPDVAQTMIQRGMAMYDRIEYGGPAADLSVDPAARRQVPPSFVKGAQDIVKAFNVFAKKFGVDAKVDVRLSGNSARVGGQLISDARGLVWKKPDGRYDVVMFMPKFGNNLAAFYATLMHEFGHVVVFEKFDALPDDTKLLIREEFRRWRDTARAAGTIEAMLTTKRPGVLFWLEKKAGNTPPGRPISRLDARRQDYHLGDMRGFHEWMADQVSRWATTTREPLSIVEKAWSSIAKTLRFFQNWMSQQFGVETRATLTMQNWLNSFLTDAAPMTEEEYVRLDLRTQKQNQAVVATASGDPNVGMTPTQPAVAVIDSQIAGAHGGKVPPPSPPTAANPDPGSAAEASAHASRITWLYEWFGSILDLAQRNPGFTPLLQYIQKARDKDRKEKEIHDAALQIAKSWRGLGRGQEEKLAQFLDEITNMTYLSDVEKQRGVQRHPTPDEVRALAAKIGIEPRGLDVAARVRRFTETMLDLVSDLARQEAMKIADPIVRAKKVDEINGTVRQMKSKPYFPFMRFGRHFVLVRTKGGVTAYFETFERKGLTSAAAQQRRKAEEMRRLHPDYEVTEGMLPKTAEPFFGLPPNMLDLIKDKLNLTPAQLDALNQLKFQLSPAMSFQHHFQHKRYTPGYSRDFLRAFSKYAFHGGRYYAKTLYVDGMRQDIRDAERAGGNIAARIADFMRDHLQNAILDVKGDYGTLKGLMFLWAMGYSPAAATLNLTQLPMVTFPYLGAQFGDAKAIKALSGAMFRFSNFYKRGTYEGLKDWELKGLGYLIRTGRVVETQAPMIAAMSQGGLFKHSSGGNLLERGANQVMEKSAFFFENAEQINRRITARAAMRLAFENPDAKIVKEAVSRYSGEYQELVNKWGHSELEARAIVTAGHVVDRTQFVYAGWARPRFMRGRIAGTIFIFKRYLQSLLFLVGSDNKFMLRYVLMAAMMGGLGGIPGVEDLKNVIQAMLRFLGYNADVEKQIQEYVRDYTGDAIPGDMVLHGMARRGWGIPAALDALGSLYTGRPGRGFDMTMAGRNVPFPQLDRSRAVTAGPIIPEAVWKAMDPSKEVGESIGGGMTQVLGYGASSMANLLKAITDNHLAVSDPKRWERAMPREMAALSKMYRALTERDPARSKPGEPWPYATRERSGAPASGTTVVRYDIRDPEQLMEVIALGLGYNDLRRANEWNRIIHQSEHTKYVDIQRKGLLEAFNEARKSSPQELGAVRKKIQEFNASVSGTEDRGKVITVETIQQSMGARERERIARERNVPVQKGNIPIAREYGRVYPRTIDLIHR